MQFDNILIGGKSQIKNQRRADRCCYKYAEFDHGKTIKQNGYPELYMPRTILYKDKIPMSATGKIDNVTLKKMVLEELQQQAAA